MRYTMKQYAHMLYEGIKEAKKKDVTEILEAFVQLVASQHDLSKMPGIIDAFTREYLQKEQKIKATIISRHPLSKEQVQKLKKFVQQQTQKEVELYEQINERILGGFILNYGDKRYDVSLKSSLKQLRQHLKS